MTPNLKKVQRKLNVLLSQTKSAIPCHLDTSEVVVCIYGSVIEYFYDVQRNEAETVVMKVVSGIFFRYLHDTCIQYITIHKRIFLNKQEPCKF